MNEGKTDQQIVDEVNDMAHIAIRHFGTGYVPPDGHKFWKAEDPRSKKAWQIAVEMYEYLTVSEVHDAVLAVEEEQAESDAFEAWWAKRYAGNRSGVPMECERAAYAAGLAARATQDAPDTTAPGAEREVGRG